MHSTNNICVYISAQLLSQLVMAEGGCKSKKRSFDVAFKLKVVEGDEQTTNREAARKFLVDKASVRYWRKQKRVAVHGSEDGDIHCLKSGEVAADAAEEIRQLTAEMLASQPDDDDDPFADLDEPNSDENKLETNELVIEDND